MNCLKGGAQGGSVLLEAIIALVIASTVAIAVTGMVSDVLLTTRRTLEREAQVSEASKLLTAVSLWPRDDLDRRLGTSRQGDMRLFIRAEGDELYSAVVYSDRPADTLAWSFFFRSAGDR